MNCRNLLGQGMGDRGHVPRPMSHGPRHAGIWLFLMLVMMGSGVGSEEPVNKRLQSFPSPHEPPVRVELVAEHASVQPGGRTKIGVHFEIEEGWHIYANDPGDAGLPTEIRWSGPSWVSFGPLQWPSPEQFLDPGNITTFGYSGTTILSSPLQCRLAGMGGQSSVPLPIRAKVEWLACKELCIPGSADLELTLPVRAEPPTLTPHAELFDHVP